MSDNYNKALRMQRRLTLELVITLSFIVSIFVVLFLAIEISPWFNFAWLVPVGLAAWKLVLAVRWDNDFYDITGRHF